MTKKIVKTPAPKLTLSFIKKMQEKFESEARKAAEKARQKWDKMTNPQRRVAVAKDVLLQLELGNVKATNGTYARPLRDKDYITLESAVDEGLGLKAVICDIKCEACARGSMFLSFVRLFNGVDANNDLNTLAQDATQPDGWDMSQNRDIKDLFGDDYALIENYFEAEDANAKYAWSTEIDKWGAKYKNPRTRLELLMKNIVKNKGEFVPSQLV